MIKNRIIVKKYKTRKNNSTHRVSEPIIMLSDVIGTSIDSEPIVNEGLVASDENNGGNTVEIEETIKKESEKEVKNNKKKNKKEMGITEEKISNAENVAMELNNKKVLKKEKGLIERTESSKIILTEDNRQLLND